MKSNKFFYGLLASGLAFAGLTQSCVSDEPFANGEGEGTLRMRLAVNANLTRAEFQSDSLSDNCTIYISGGSGLLYKYKGVDNVPEEINMKSGNYVAEAWTGDSVPASFDKRFFKGRAPFSITQGNTSQVVVTCRVANVVVSVNPETIDDQLMKDWTITVANSAGELVFNEENMSYAMGYFMMPNRDIKLSDDGAMMKDDQQWPLYTNLTYRIEGKNAAGDDFVKEGLIEGSKGNGIVEHAHNYILNLQYNPDYQEQGGSFITVTVNDYEEVVTETVGLYSRPAIKGVGFDIESLVKGSEGDFRDVMVKVSGFGSLAGINLSSDDYAALHLPNSSIDLITAAPAVKNELNEAGISWEISKNEERNLQTCYITFGAAFLNKIAQRDEQAYVINILAKDGYGKQNTADLRIGVGEVEEDPVTTESPSSSSDLMAILSRRAVIPVAVGEDAVNPGIEYRVKGDSGAWKFAPVASTRAGVASSVNLTGLNPGTEYEFRAVADGFKSSVILTFKTETAFQLPNSSMEDWSNYTSSIIIPGADGKRTFWDTGNHGSSTLKVTLTNGSTDMFHTGQMSAKLRSQFVGITSTIGKFAAGNLFVGEYAETKGTNGVINFGRPYDGSHPDALKLWVNYRPGAATKSTAGSHVAQGSLDEGQIYVAFTTGTVRVDTSDKNTLFSKDRSDVIGYGEFNFTSAYGEEGKLDELTIPVTWKDSASKVRPTHIIIVCSASRYGDYFEGGEGSTMYVDDFELVY